MVKREEVMKMIEERQQILEKVIKKAQQEKGAILPGTLNIACVGNRARYYHFNADGKRESQYITKNDMKLISGLAQQDYNRLMLSEAEKEYKLNKHYLEKSNQSTGIDDVYSVIHPERRKLIAPILISDEEYVTRWEAVEYTGKAFSEDMPELYTDKGERVRSKSEVIIANALARHRIPYRYEFPIKLKNYGTVYPDFCCLNVRKRREIYWEHAGLMNEPEYVMHFVAKVNDYAQNGIVTGKNLIITMENTGYPLNSKIIDQIICTNLV